MPRYRRQKADPDSSIEAFVACATDAFELAGPLCQFGSCPEGGSGPGARLRGSLSEGACIGFGWEDVRIARLPIPDGAARTVLCVDAPGYVLQPQRMVDEMVRILSPGGTLLICVPGAATPAGRESGDWRLTPRGLERLLAGMEARLLGWQGDESFPHTLYGIGFKPPLGNAVVPGTNRFLERFPARLDLLARRIGWRRRLKESLAARVSGRPEARRWRDYYKLRFAVHFPIDGTLHDELPRSCLRSEKS